MTQLVTMLGVDQDASPTAIPDLEAKSYAFLSDTMNRSDGDREGFVSIVMARTGLDAGAPYGLDEVWDSGLFIAVGWEGLEGSMSLEKWGDVAGVGTREGVQVEVHHVCFRGLGS